MILWCFWWCRLRTAIRFRGNIVAVRSWSRFRRVARNAECDETVLGSIAEWLHCRMAPSQNGGKLWNYSAILICPFFDVVGVCLCEILPCFCMVVNLEKSSFWVGCSVFDVARHFGDEKTTESISFAVFSPLGFVMWKTISLHCIFALVMCPDVVLIDDFWGDKLMVLFWLVSISEFLTFEEVIICVWDAKDSLLHSLAWALLFSFLRWVTACVWRNVPVYSSSLI